MTRALIIIDVQNDYFPGGNMELDGMGKAAGNCALLLRQFREKGLPIFHIQHLSTGESATFFIPGTLGCEIHREVQPLSTETLITKAFPSAFRDTELDQKLREAKISKVVVCGAMSHMCIDTSVRAAFDLGYSCELVSDACATRDLEFEGRTVDSKDVQAAYMAALGAVFATVTTTRELIKGASD